MARGTVITGAQVFSMTVEDIQHIIYWSFKGTIALSAGTFLHMECGEFPMDSSSALTKSYLCADIIGICAVPDDSSMYVLSYLKKDNERVPNLIS